MRKKKTLFASAACGVICAICVLLFMKGVQGEAEAQRAEALERYGGEQHEACVATRDIAAGDVVGESDVETKLWVVDLLPEGSLGSPDQVVGKQASSPVMKGEVFLEKRFAEVAKSIEVPTGCVAISVPVKDVQAVGGAIVAGSRVDVYSTGGSETQMLAQNLLVLDTSAQSKGLVEEGMNWVTLAVEPGLSQEMVAAAQKTDIYLALPGEGVPKEKSASSDKKTGKDDVANKTEDNAGAKTDSGKEDEQKADEASANPEKTEAGKVEADKAEAEKAQADGKEAK